MTSPLTAFVESLRIRIAVTLFIFLCFFITPLFCFAAELKRDMVLEAGVIERLEKIAPGVVVTFQEATLAADKGDFAAAEKGYRQVLQAAPNFDAALRRLSWRVKKKEEALDLARRAVKINPDQYNKTAELGALLRFEDEKHTDLAMTIAKELSKSQPDDGYIQSMIAQAAVAKMDDHMLEKAVANLQRIEPDIVTTPYYAAILALWNEDCLKAEEEFDKAIALGYQPEKAKRIMKESGAASILLKKRFVKFAVVVLVVCIIGMVVMLLWLILSGRNRS